MKPKPTLKLKIYQPLSTGDV